MKYIVDSMWRYIVDIFVEDFGDTPLFDNIQARDLTEHYRVDFPKLELDGVFVGVQYSYIEGILESYKYHSERSHARVFVDIFKDILQKQDMNESVLMTVPMHWSRYTLRGFDHMDYLAKKLSNNIGITYIQPLKTSFSRRQSRLSREKRLENRKNHFTIDNSTTLPRKIFLIDDVISTGATAHECAKLLKKHGVEEVIGIFLASSAQ